MIAYDTVQMINEFPETVVLNKFKYELVGTKCWSFVDLTDWLEDQGLDPYNAESYAEHLHDYMFENELGYEYGGITPWCGEGYILY